MSLILNFSVKCKLSVSMSGFSPQNLKLPGAISVHDAGRMDAGRSHYGALHWTAERISVGMDFSHVFDML